MDLRLRISSGLDDGLAWAIDVELLSMVGGEALDADRFRFAKQTKHSVGAFVTILTRLVAEATNGQVDDFDDSYPGLYKAD